MKTMNGVHAWLGEQIAVSVPPSKTSGDAYFKLFSASRPARLRRRATPLWDGRENEKPAVESLCQGSKAALVRVLLEKSLSPRNASALLCELFQTHPLAPRVDRGRLNRYFFAMSTQQLTTEAMALPLSERVSLAQALWQSIDAGLADTDECEAVREAMRRDQELSSGAVVGRTHEEVMQAARRAIGCA